MRLLHATHDKIEEVLSEENAEEYVTLSHTWGREEVTFQHWEQLLASSRPEIEAMAGYEKIDLCRQQARSDGYDWVWIDTYGPHISRVAFVIPVLRAIPRHQFKGLR